MLRACEIIKKSDILHLDLIFILHSYYVIDRIWGVSRYEEKGIRKSEINTGDIKKI